MQLSLEEAGTAKIIRVNASRIDAPSAIQFKEDMRQLTRRDPGRYVLDLAQVEFLDSSGLGAIVASMKQLQPDQTLELAAVQPIVDKVLRLTRMDTIFRIHEDADTAGVGAPT